MKRLACLALCSLALVPAPALAASARPEAASWHGRAIARVVKDGRTLPIPASFPRGWAAGQVRLGTGRHREGGSARVREVQRRLWALGFRPGPVDGLFGPQTKAAVEWFQVKHGLRPTGVVSLATLTALRQQKGARSVRTEAPGGADAGPRLTKPRPAAPIVAARRSAPGSAYLPIAAQGRGLPHDGGGLPGAIVVFAGLLLSALLLALGRSPQGWSERTRLRGIAATGGRRIAAAGRRGPRVLASLPTRLLGRVRAPRQRRRTTLPMRPPKPRRRAAPRTVAVAPAAWSVRVALGYVRGDKDGHELRRHARAIEHECSRRGWALACVLRDDDRTAIRSPIRERPGLMQTLARLTQPGGSRLVVSRLGHLSRSAKDLRLLFEWFAQHQVEVIVLDVGIDTTTRDGRRAALAVLRAIARRQAGARGNGNDHGHGNGRKAPAKIAVANAGAVGPVGAHARERGDPG
jgi:Putative peptidoglycan binding domain/Resolvase, N terminal domain